MAFTSNLISGSSNPHSFIFPSSFLLTLFASAKFDTMNSATSFKCIWKIEEVEREEEKKGEICNRTHK